MRKNAFACCLILVAAFGLSAQDKKKSGGKGILQPQMTVETGSYDKPAGKLGEKPVRSMVEHDRRRGSGRQGQPGKGSNARRGNR